MGNNHLTYLKANDVNLLTNYCKYWLSLYNIHYLPMVAACDEVKDSLLFICAQIEAMSLCVRRVQVGQKSAAHNISRSTGQRIRRATRRAVFHGPNHRAEAPSRLRDSLVRIVGLEGGGPWLGPRWLTLASAIGQHSPQHRSVSSLKHGLRYFALFTTENTKESQREASMHWHLARKTVLG